MTLGSMSLPTLPKVIAYFDILFLGADAERCLSRGNERTLKLDQSEINLCTSASSFAVYETINLACFVNKCNKT